MNASIQQRLLLGESDVIVISKKTYGEEILLEARAKFEDFKKKGVLKGEFDDDSWKIFDEVHAINIHLDIDEFLYFKNGLLDVSLNEAKKMLRVYAIMCLGQYTARGVKVKIKSVRKLLLHKDEIFSDDELFSLFAFLIMTGMSEADAEMFLDDNIAVKHRARSGQRPLENIMTYMIISDFAKKMYTNIPKEGMSEEQVHFFPVWFWSTICMQIPLRATETVLTPYDCLQDLGDGKVRFSVRRTLLKKKNKTVFYNLENDYKIDSYVLSSSASFDVIRRYKEATEDSGRSFLFACGKNSNQAFFTLNDLNCLIREFSETFLEGNREYDNAVIAAGLNGLAIVTAGDSRPIAISNIILNGFGAQAARDLAGHESIDVTSGYYTNVSNTFHATAIMKWYYKTKTKVLPEGREEIGIEPHARCTSRRLAEDSMCLDDCAGHLSDCFGCKYYVPAKGEAKERLEREKAEMDKCSQEIIKFINIAGTKSGEDIEHTFLMLQTHGAKLKDAVEIYSNEQMAERRKKYGEKM